MNDVDAAHAVILIVITIVWITLWVLAVLSIAKRPGLSGFERGAWVAIAILFPVIGPLVWAAWGRTRRRAPLQTPEFNPD